MGAEVAEDVGLTGAEVGRVDAARDVAVFSARRAAAGRSSQAAAVQDDLLLLRDELQRKVEHQRRAVAGPPLGRMSMQ